MTIIGLLRLLRKHFVLLLFTPILMAGLVIYFTKNPSFTYSSETTLYTGLASGSSVEMGKAISYFATNTDFDNLINVIQSRQTQEEVSIRLLAQHLMLSNADPRFISQKSFDYLKKITPTYVKALVIKSNKQILLPKSKTSPVEINANQLKDTTLKISQEDSTFSFSKLYSSSNENKIGGSPIEEAAFNQTVKNLTDLFASSDTNFVSHLLNFDNPHFSIDAISSINVQRIGSSDLVKLKYTSDDPGICQQTLIFLTQVCLKNYKVLKENRSDAVVKYFEFQVNQATQKLNAGEEKLLSFNKDNKIINYYEQSKAVAGAKEALDVDYNNMRIKLAGVEADIRRLEEKLENQQGIKLKSVPLIEKRNQLSQIDTKIATAETIGYADTSEIKNLPQLKARADQLKNEIRESVGELYKFGNSTEGLPMATLLNEWISNILKYEDLNAGLVVLSKRIQEFQKQYEIFAPAGANLKRIEREISVSEAEFLELLHGLNLAKLKMQDLELSSNLKPIDQPFFPLTPNPTKRKFLIIGAALFGFLMVFTTIMALEFFDETLKTPPKAAKILNLSPLGVFPKVYLKTEILNFPYVIERLIEMMVQQIRLLKKEKGISHEPYHIIICSTSNGEGKTVISQNIASQLNKLGNRVAVIRYSRENAQQQESSAGSIIAPELPHRSSTRFSFFNWLLGYSDNRINYQSHFLSEFGSHLSKKDYYEYTINENYFQVNDYQEMFAKNKLNLTINPDYILTILPPLLYYPYPSGLVASADLIILVCRANREWSLADRGVFENISRITSRQPCFVLNGVEMEVIESTLGELPKKRGLLRRSIKKIIRFQFKTKNQI